MRNSSLVKQSRAEDVPGLKHSTEAMGFLLLGGIGRGAFQGERRSTVRTAGPPGSEYAGISNEKTDEKSVRRKPKVSWAMLIIPG